MNPYTRSHLSDGTLIAHLRAHAAQDRAITAELLADLAEVDERRLYLPAGYPSMFAYCAEELHFSEDMTYKRIQAARTARRYPAIFSLVAEGRLHLSGICLLAPHLEPENADHLLKEAAHQSKAGIEQLLANRFPRPEVPTLMRVVRDQPAPGQVPEPVLPPPRPLEPAPGQVQAPIARPKIAPIAPLRYALQFTMSQEMYDDLRRAQALLSHVIPSGDAAQVLHRALQALIAQLERRKFGMTDRSHKALPRQSSNPRHIPSAIRHAVTERDRGRCTFVSASGHRCEARKMLEFDHVLEVARGGRATVENLRLRCRSHNQFAAEQTFGVDLMTRKREDARHGPPRMPVTLTATEARSRSCLFGPGLRPLPSKELENHRLSIPSDGSPPASPES